MSFIDNSLSILRLEWSMAVTLAETPELRGPQSWLSGWLDRPEGWYAVILACHLPMLAMQWHKLWQIECYWYFPVLLAVVVLLLRRRWHQLPVRPVCQPTPSSLATLLIGLCLLAAAVLLGSPWLGTVAAIICSLAALRSFGRRAAARLTPVWALLWLMVPLPFRWDQRLFLWLQGWACEGGSRLLDAWGYNHVLAGYVLDVPGRQFRVEELSHGIQSLFALIAAAAVLAVWQRRGLIHGALLVCSGAFWAVTLNMLGVALTVVLQVARGFDVTDGGARYLFAAGLFLIEFLILLSTDRLLLFLGESPGVKLAEDEEGNLIGVPADVAGESEAPSVPVADMSNRPVAARLVLRLLAAAFLAVGVFQGATWAVHGQRTNEAPARARRTDGDDRVPLTHVLTGDSLPPSLGGWRAVDFQAATRAPDSDLGHYSLAWRYADARDEAVVSLEFPFVGWHDSTRSFELRGWAIESRTVLQAGASGGPVLEVRMRDASGRRAYLLVSQWTDSGHALTPPATAGGALSAWCKNARERVLHRFGEAESEPATFKIRLLVTGDLPLDETRQGQAWEAFQLAAARIIERVWPEEASP